MNGAGGSVPGPRRLAPPVNRPAGFAPTYAAFEPRFAAGTDDLVVAIFGIENRGGDAGPLRRRLLGALMRADGPVTIEHGVVRAGYGPPSEVWFAYWRDIAAHARWSTASGIDALFDDASLLEGTLGLWREQGLISLDHNETSHSRADDLTGIATLADAVATTDIHGYWGSARDRLAAAAGDPLASELATVPPAPDPGMTLGRRLRVVAPNNVCLIRSSQDLTRTNQEQLRYYAAEVEPSLLAGLRYLRKPDGASGCLGVRLIDETDADGTPLGRSSVVGYFASLDALEAWTHRHPTHARIMASFLGLVRRFGGEPGLHLWHEITVFPAGRLVGDYVNCSPDGGLLRISGDLR